MPDILCIPALQVILKEYIKDRLHITFTANKVSESKIVDELVMKSPFSDGPKGIEKKGFWGIALE